jgi:hypothetical protein
MRVSRDHDPVSTTGKAFNPLRLHEPMVGSQRRLTNPSFQGGLGGLGAKTLVPPSRAARPADGVLSRARI